MAAEAREQVEQMPVNVHAAGRAGLLVRLRAGTVLVAAVMYGTFNALAGVPLLAVRGGSDLTVGFTGFSGIIAMCILAAPALLVPPRMIQTTGQHTIAVTDEG